jgi:hypothetical protein
MPTPLGFQALDRCRSAIHLSTSRLSGKHLTNAGSSSTEGLPSHRGFYSYPFAKNPRKRTLGGLHRESRGGRMWLLNGLGLLEQLHKGEAEMRRIHLCPLSYEKGCQFRLTRPITPPTLAFPPARCQASARCNGGSRTGQWHTTAPHQSQTTALGMPSHTARHLRGVRLHDPALRQPEGSGTGVEIGTMAW